MVAAVIRISRNLPIARDRCPALQSGEPGARYRVRILTRTCYASYTVPRRPIPCLRCPVGASRVHEVARSDVSSPQSKKSLAIEVLYWPARLIVLGVIVASPWYYGSVSWNSQLWLLPWVLVACLLAMIGALLQKQRWDNPLVFSLAALLVLSVVQTWSLPDWLWQRVATGAAFERQAAELQSQFESSEPSDAKGTLELPDVPRTLSVHWLQTRASATTLAMAVAWLIAAGILFRTARWELVLTITLAATGVVIGMLGLLQLVTWNSWTLLPMPTATYFATFVSRNSAPQFLSVGLGCLLGLLMWWSNNKTDNADKRYYVRYPAVNILARLRRRIDDLVVDIDAVSISLIVLVTLLFVTILAANSRGGIVAGMAATAITLCVALKAQQGLVRAVALSATILGIGLLLLTTLELDSAIVKRIESIDQEAYELNNGRMQVWGMILSHPSIWIPGCGLGNFHFAVLPTYQSPNAWFYHAENIYIELLAEFGVLGFAIGMTGLVWLVWRIRGSYVAGRQAAPTMIAGVFAFSFVGLQSMVDFSLIVPGVFLPLGALAGCFVMRSQMSDYGKATRREGQSRHSSRHRNSSEPGLLELHMLPMSCTVYGVILCVALLGIPSLRGFILADRLNKELERIEGSQSGKSDLQMVESVLNGFDTPEVKQASWHPEVSLQIGRGFQAYAERLMINSKWPEELTPEAIRLFSKPQTVAAAFRCNLEVQVDEGKKKAIQARNTAATELKEIAQQPVPQSLQRSLQYMLPAYAMCSSDWRPCWGIFRSDVDALSPRARARNYARLALNSTHSATIPPNIGVNAVTAGEMSVAKYFLPRYMTWVPSQAGNIVMSIVKQVTADELLSLLPDSPQVRTAVARRLKDSVDYKDQGSQIVEKLDLEQLIAEAKQQSIKEPTVAAPWVEVAWLAEEKENTPALIEAYRHIVNMEPMGHARRAQFAVILWKNEMWDEAKEQSGRAKRLEPGNADYEKLDAKIRAGESHPHSGE